MSNPGIIIQARMGSSRCHGKVMMEVKGTGKKLIDLIIDECKKTKLPVVCAIPHDKEDGTLYNHILRKCKVFEGSEGDVISRYYYCAKEYKFDPIIRVCADAKKIHHELILQQLENFYKFKHMIYGNYCEVFSFEQLEWYYLHDKRNITREHVAVGMTSDLTVDYEIDLDDS